MRYVICRAVIKLQWCLTDPILPREYVTTFAVFLPQRSAKSSKCKYGKIKVQRQFYCRIEQPSFGILLLSCQMMSLSLTAVPTIRMDAVRETFMYSKWTQVSPHFPLKVDLVRASGKLITGTKCTSWEEGCSYQVQTCKSTNEYNLSWRKHELN